MKFKKTILTPNRILLEFPSRKELVLHMFRISEFFESPYKDILGKRFSFDVFIDRYSNKKGEIDYFSFWDGYNVPKNTIDNFAILYKDAISEREADVIKAVKELKDSGYVIACVFGDQITKKHEIAHGRFFEDKEYRHEATRVVLSIPKNIREKMKTSLRKIHYNDDVMIDEIHAYLVAYNRADFVDVFEGKIKEKYIRKHINVLQNLYKMVK